MSDFAYLQNDRAISRVEAQRLEPVETLPWCELCDTLEDNCASLACASCGERHGRCAVDCGEADHLLGCPFPAEACRCKAIKTELSARAAEAIAEEALEAHREERAS